MKMSNSFYDAAKWIVLIFLPSLAVLISGLGELYNYANTPITVTSINLVNVFLGSILQLSSQKYNDDNDSRGGGLVVTSYPKHS